MRYIPIEKELIPYQFDIQLQGETFTFEIHYNAEHNFFTIDLMKNDEVLVYGEKIIYGKSLFSAYADRFFPKNAIIPFDLSEKEMNVTFENINKTVFLYIFTEEDMHNDI